MVALAWWLAVFFPYAFSPQPLTFFPAALWPALMLVLLGQAPFLWGYGLYRGIWRFASLPDLWNIVRAALIGALTVFLLLFLVQRLEGIPRASLLLYPLLLMLLLGLPRLLYRLWRDGDLYFVFQARPETRVLIIGAGRMGELLARDMRRGREYLPLGFIDDEPKVVGCRIHGVPVLGTVSDLPVIAERHKPDLIIIAVPSASDLAMQRMVEICEQVATPFRTLPKISDLGARPLDALRQLRDVSIEDLLGREKIELDWDRIHTGVTDKVILVSGGGGSIGSELCVQIARCKPKLLIIFERGEFNLYQVEKRLRQEQPEVALKIILGDVCDRRAVAHVLATWRPQLIFHAAAFKHVPMLEDQIRSAARNNIFGTATLAQAAVDHGCEQFVLISTDKAVNPTNIMGATKRASELFCQALNDELLCGNQPGQNPTRFITVRFGNVLGSAGSVVPLFKEQIASGGPVTVTHPEISRFFMTIPESCQLILQAGAMGMGGEIFVLDMGVPIKIRYLAEQLIKLAGKVPERDIEIVYTGLRPGEKLYEELFHAEEHALSQTSHHKILLAAPRRTDWAHLSAQLDRLRDASDHFEESALRDLLREIVPEYQPAP